MSHRLLPRFTDTRIEDERRVAKAILDSGGEEDVVPSKNPKHALAKPGDPRVLRAIPVIARGVGGAIPNTNPLGALIASERLR